ncbi:MAG: hypothetical protein E6X49_13885 [Leclercia adecarboxylata]|nr:hypothetical protein [uncultured Leclercia sp.]MDU4842218.1 hypothetical protein [Leclercia adecarboxylata]
MRSILACLFLAIPTLAFADGTRYEIPLDGNMANALTPSLAGAPANVERSLRIKSISATHDDIIVVVRVDAIDTTKPKDESLLPDRVQNATTKNMIVKKYCSPFGNGDLFFDTLRQRNVTLHYHFEAGSDVTFLSFNVNKSDCD